MHTMPYTATIQSRSFALAFMDATVLYLNGAAEIGSARATLFAQARDRANTAILYTDTEIEVEMARAFIDKIDNFEERRLHV